MYNFIYPIVRTNPEYHYDSVLSGYNYNFSLIDDILSTGLTGGDITRVQDGINIFTGGSDNFPTVNLSDNIVLNSVSASTFSGDTFYLSGTSIYDIFALAGSDTNSFVTGFTYNNSNDY